MAKLHFNVVNAGFEGAARSALAIGRALGAKADSTYSLQAVLTLDEPQAQTLELHALVERLLMPMYEVLNERGMERAAGVHSIEDGKIKSLEISVPLDDPTVIDDIRRAFGANDNGMEIVGLDAAQQKLVSLTAATLHQKGR